MTRTTIALPAALDGRTFTVAEGRAAGLSEWCLSRRSLRAPARGLRAATPAPASDDVVARCRELLPALPPGAAFSHATALDLLGVDRPAGLDRPDALHVLVPGGQDRPRRPGVVGHRRHRTREPVVLRHGLPVLPPEQVWHQLATELTVDELVVLGDALVRRRSPITTLRALTRSVDRAPAGMRGLRLLRSALPSIRPRTDSCPETRLRLLLVAAGLPCPEVNILVTDPAGYLLAMPDLCYHAQRIAIEYDGDVHRTDRRTWRRDVARRRALESAGWRMLTCTADDLRTTAPALAWLRRALADH